MVRPHSQLIMNELEDFTYLLSSEKDTIPIKILTGPYKDVIVRFGTIRFLEEDPPVLQFTFQIETEEKQHLKEDPEFRDTLSSILTSIIHASVERETGNRENYFKEPDDFGGVFEEDTSIP